MHLAALLQAGAEIVAVSDNDPHIADNFAKTLSCTAFSSAKETVQHVGIDLAVVMGRPTEMPHDLETMIRAGVPCVVEKPIAGNATELEPLAQLAHKHSAFVAVPLPNRCSPLWEAARRLEHDHRLGRVVHAHFRINNGPARRYINDGVPWMLDASICGGGALRNLGIHGVDAFRQAVHPESVRVEHAIVRAERNGANIEEYALVTLVAESGAVGVVEAGYTFATLEAGGDFEWRLVTDNATLIERDDRLIQATLDDGVRLETLIPAQSGRYHDFARDTLERLRSGQPPLVTIHDCLEAMRLIDTAYQHASSAKGNP